MSEPRINIDDLPLIGVPAMPWKRRGGGDYCDCGDFHVYPAGHTGTGFFFEWSDSYTTVRAYGSTVKEALASLIADLRDYSGKLTHAAMDLEHARLGPSAKTG